MGRGVERGSGGLDTIAALLSFLLRVISPLVALFMFLGELDDDEEEEEEDEEEGIGESCTLPSSPLSFADALPVTSFIPKSDVIEDILCVCPRGTLSELVVTESERVRKGKNRPPSTDRPTGDAE